MSFIRKLALAFGILMIGLSTVVAPTAQAQLPVNLLPTNNCGAPGVYPACQTCGGHCVWLIGNLACGPLWIPPIFGLPGKCGCIC